MGDQRDEMGQVGRASDEWRGARMFVSGPARQAGLSSLKVGQLLRLEWVVTEGGDALAVLSLEIKAHRAGGQRRRVDPELRGGQGRRGQGGGKEGLLAAREEHTLPADCPHCAAARPPCLWPPPPTWNSLRCRGLPLMVTDLSGYLAFEK